MKIILAEAAHCEHAGALGYETGHVPGNQTGDELRAIAYYNLPWTYVLRCKNKDIREACARRVYIATTNKHVGYGQPTRNGVLYQLQKGIDICNIVEDVDCDCSSIQSAVSWYTLKTQGITTTIRGDEYTGNMYDHFMKSGWYEDVTSKVNLKTGEGLVMGDVLLTPGKHTAIVYSVQSDFNKVPQWVGKAIQYVKVYKDVEGKVPCEIPALGDGNLIDVCDSTDTLYYIRVGGKYYGFVKKTAIINQEPKPIKGVVTTGLNLRNKPLTGLTICVMREGSIVNIRDTVKAENGANWYLVNYNGIDGYCSAKYVKTT